MVFHFVDIGGIDDHHSLKFPLLRLYRLIL